MKADFRDALLLAIEKGVVPAPADNEAWAVLNARTLPLNDLDRVAFALEQGFRPEYLALEQAGWSVVPRIDETSRFDHVIVMAGRVRAVNEANVARAWQMVRSAGAIIVCGDKTAGIASLRKWVTARAPLQESYSKHHALVFRIEKSDAAAEFGIESASPHFSADGPDKGSELLARFFDERISGKVADFGAGSGYVTGQLLAKAPSVVSVDLMEAEWAALEQARHIFEHAPVPLEFHWIDITAELKKKPYDWVIMNPPFHHGLHGSRDADPELGKRFIQRAASTLVQGGRLLMVANRNLPYEHTLQSAFRKFEKLADEGGYKVFEAIR